MADKVQYGAALRYAIEQLGGPLVEQTNVVSVDNAVKQIAIGNGERVWLTIVNIGASNVYVGITPDVSSTKGILLGASGGSATLNVRDDFTLPSREWNAICPAGGPVNVLVIEAYRFAQDQEKA